MRAPASTVEPKLRRRQRLKNKEARSLKEDLQAVFGSGDFWPDEAAVETADFGEQGVIIVDNQVVGLRDETGPFLSVRGVLAYRPTTRWVTVDMGAVRFVTNGADIMGPGITEVDPSLAPGDWCWVRDEKNRQPLGIGKCLVPAADMRGKGKAVGSVHHIGDKLWTFES